MIIKKYNNSTTDNDRLIIIRIILYNTNKSHKKIRMIIQ